jgi:Zn-dependent oligopeptidase
MTPFGEMRGSQNTDEVQLVSKAIDPKLIAYGTEVLLNEKLFERIEP